MSPSIRREWIEIILTDPPYNIGKSPSIRREWIEILMHTDSDDAGNGLPPYGGSGLKSNISI